MSARRGHVWLVDFDPVEGHEQAGRRPALILSVDPFNTRVEVRPPEGGLTVPSYVIGEQTRTISTRRLVKPLGVLSTATMARVADVVRVLLGV